MQIKRIELINFRNHQHLVLDEVGSVLIIVGNNAVGKTNIIEALQFLSMHESFRLPKNEELFCRWGSKDEQAIINIETEALNSINTKQIAFIQNKRVFFYNKKERPAKELLDLIPAVLFTPDDLQIIKGPPEQRRTLLDSLGARLSKSFAQIKTDYYKVLRQKNNLLKQEETERELLDSWNINMAKLGTSLYKHRLGLFEKLLSAAAEIYNTISEGEILTGRYTALWMAEEDLYESLLQNREAEILAKRSLVGPHRDDICFEIDGHDARRFASQGQQRSIALALKMAEIEILRNVSEKNPLLLLDDVMSELDETRRRHFVNLIGTASQTVLTTTNLGYFNEEFLSRATVVELDDQLEQTECS